jgi:phage terminase small subunit
MALTKKRKVFIEEYLKCWNGAEAARRAGYKFPRRQASYLLTILDIQEEIERRIAEKVMSADECLIRLAEQARCIYAEYIDKEGKIDLAKIKADGKMHLIAGTKETKYGLQVQFYDGQSALIQIGKHHKLFTDSLELSGGPLVVKYTGNVDPEDV